MNFGGRVAAQLACRDQKIQDHNQRQSTYSDSSHSGGGPRCSGDQREISDTDLLFAHVAGDMRAFNILMQRYHRPLLWLARQNSRRDVDASDALQEAWFKAMTKAKTFRGDASVSTWLSRIVVNSCRDRFRRRVEHTHGGIEEVAAVVDNQMNSPSSSDPCVSLAIRAAMTRLSEDQRNVIHVVDLLGYSVAEASQKLGIAEGTVKSRRARARAQMREYLSS